MNFHVFATNNLVEEDGRPAATHWWTEISAHGTGCPHVTRNVLGDQLFELDVERAVADLKAFARGLHANSAIACPKKRAKKAINEGGCMVCAGPHAAVEGTFVRLEPIWSVTEYLFDRHNRANYGARRRRDLADLAEDLLDPEFFQEKIVQSVRGTLPVAFWASERDLQDFGLDQSADHVRGFLGMDPAEPEHGPHLLIRLVGFPSDEEDVMRVPTGWDGFDHEHFQPAGPGAASGRTKNLVNGGPGAQEVVTRPKSLPHLQPVRVVQ